MDLSEFIDKIGDMIINPIIQVLFAVALVVFLWGVFEFIKGSDSEEARKKGTQHIFWGIIGMVIMVSVFGIIRILLNTFGINDSDVNEVLGYFIQ
jgi:uncharacterized membrane protein